MDLLNTTLAAVTRGNDSILTTTTNDSIETTTDTANGKLRYISEDSSLEKYLEFQAAWGLDIGFTPICSAIGIIGSILSIIVLLLSKKSTTYQYLAMIAATDILVLILNIMFLARKFPGHEIFHPGTCGLIFFLMYFAIHYNVALIVTVTLERFIAIKYPLQATGWFTIKRARIIIVIEGILAFGFDMHNFFTRQMIVDKESGMEMCSQEGEMNIFFIRKIWPWFDAVVYCYLPLFCLFTLNVLIIREVRKAGNKKRQMISSNTETGEEMASESKKQERQITIMMLLVSFCFLIFVSPMAVIIVVERYYWIPTDPHDKATFHLVRTITNHMMYLNHALNFILYCLSGSRFRQQFKVVFCKCLKKKNKRSQMCIENKRNCIEAKDQSSSNASNTGSNTKPSDNTVSTQAASAISQDLPPPPVENPPTQPLEVPPPQPIEAPPPQTLEAPPPQPIEAPIPQPVEAPPAQTIESPPPQPIETQPPPPIEIEDIKQVIE